METNGEQTPWIASNFFGDFVFRPSGEPPSAGKEKEPEARRRRRPSTLPGSIALRAPIPTAANIAAWWRSPKRNDQFNFTWWIGKDVFRGSGHFAGKMLVVNWGDKTPVIYTFGDEGALDGEWADGSATETLEPVANAAPGDIGLSEGSYRVDGKNADGSGYQGNVEITEQGNGYHLTWQVGSSSYEGDGTLAGNLLTVDWGASTPVVYALKPDGSLAGLWDAGQRRGNSDARRVSAGRCHEL